MVWGWIVIAIFTMSVRLVMAEICSSILTSGGPYFWASKFARAKNSAFAAWFTGWFNLFGYIGHASGTVATPKTSFALKPKYAIGIYAAILIDQARQVLRMENQCFTVNTICQSLINAFG